MSMTMEEIIKKYEVAVEGGKQIAPLMGEDAKEIYEMLKSGLSALRPITREQVKETKAVFFQPSVEDVAQDSYRCSHCYVQEFGDTRGINFCPHCGAPMTDEAVDMVMKRLEEMQNGQ